MMKLLILLIISLPHQRFKMVWGYLGTGGHFNLRVLRTNIYKFLGCMLKKDLSGCLMVKLHVCDSKYPGISPNNE
jgi:hypothetical protein